MGDKFILIVGIIAGLAIGGLVGWLWTSLSKAAEIANLEKDMLIIENERDTYRDQWELAQQELNSTRVLLNDTLSALELLRQYQSIDNETRRDIDELESTRNPDGSSTDETYNRFRELVDNFNQLNEEFNTQTGPQVLPGPTIKINITDFIELRQEAETLFKTATDLLLQYKE